jgi:hypothetical protein
MAERARKSARARPTELDKRIQGLKHRLATHEQTASPEDGPGAAALRLYAEEQAPILQEAWGMPDEVDRVRIVEYLYGTCGLIAHAFPGKPELPSFADWAS